MRLIFLTLVLTTPSLAPGKDCLAGSTRVRLADQSERAVAEIRPNDRLWNPFLKKMVRVKTVSSTPESDRLMEIRTAQRQLVVSSLHPILTAEGFVLAEALAEGSFVMNAKNAPERVTAVRSLTETRQPVFAIELDPEGSLPQERVFEANGLAAGDSAVQRQMTKGRRQLAGGKPTP